MDQRSLFERARQGDPDAFGGLIGDQLGRLDGAARLILRDPELARDAVQEASLRAWKHLRGVRDADRFGPWLPACSSTSASTAPGRGGAA